MLLVIFCVYSIKSSIYLTHCWILYFFFLTILLGWFSSRDMSRIELDCKNYKCFDNNKCDRSCKKLLNKARIRTVQGLGLKNAEIKKHDESNISDQTCKHSQAYRWRPHWEGMFIGVRLAHWGGIVHQTWWSMLSPLGWVSFWKGDHLEMTAAICS